MTTIEEKGHLLPGAECVKVKPSTRRSTAARVAVCIFGWVAITRALNVLYNGSPSTADVCSQVSELIPEKNGDLWDSLTETYGTEIFKLRAAGWLGGAVRVPTETYDHMEPVGVDHRWEKFDAFHEYLLEAFPLVHSHLELTKVNTYGLLFEWKGSDDSLQPLLFAAHQDVVPVEPTTYNQWKYEPFSGYFDGERIWGRGTTDYKSGLIGIMSTIETLLEQKFQPSRSVVLTFGFDEEVGGSYGAQHLGKVILEKFGKNSFAMLVDEGGVYQEKYGQIFASLGVGEKGSLNIQVDVASPGGHSSLPPPHTSIGMLAQLLVHFENNPFKVHFTRGSPMYHNARCLAAHAPNLDAKLRYNLLKSSHSDRALRAAEKELFKDPKFKGLVSTTQAIDLVEGGVKSNALPENAWAVINHRISPESSVDAVKVHDTELLRSLASSFNLSYNAFGIWISDGKPTYGYLNLTTWGVGLEPAPITPTDGDAAPYDLLSGTIKAAYNSHRNITGDYNIVVRPGTMPANTDTRYYWSLTKHIFRYNHLALAEGEIMPTGMHTVNESIVATNFVEIIRFYTALILNADESTLL